MTARLLRRARLNRFYKGDGREDMANFVSKRLQRLAAAMLCLMAMQLGMSVVSGDPTPVADVVTISR